VHKYYTQLHIYLCAQKSLYHYTHYLEYNTISVSFYRLFALHSYLFVKIRLYFVNISCQFLLLFCSLFLLIWICWSDANELIHLFVFLVRAVWAPLVSQLALCDNGGKQRGGTQRVELCVAAAPPPPPTECRRRAGAVFETCSRHVVHQLYVARFL